MTNCNKRIKLVLLISMLFSLTIGQMWAGTKRIYCEYSGVSSWWGTVYVYAWGGEKDAKKYTMVATGTTNLVRCDIDDYHTDLLFYKSSTQEGSWETQSVDVSISSNNRWSLGDGGYGNKATISNQQRYAPGTAIDGLVDIKNPHNQMFSNGTFSATLEAHKTYEFKILETSTLYGLNDLIATSSISNQTLNTSGYQVRLCTAGTGTYTFAYNTTNHQLSITYPEALHPSIDYCYVIDYSWSPSANLHLWDGTSTKVAEWDGSSTVAGSTWPGAALSNKTTIGGQSYFYIAPGEFDYFMVSKNGDETDRTGEVQPSDGYSKRRYWNGSSWVWDTFTVRIQLENEDATSAGTEYQDIAFNSGVLSDITCPTKTHYDFQGYYTEDGGTGTQVIDKDGHWIASVTDYTDASKHWIHAGMSTTIYAKWTEHEYTITTAVSPAGAGSVSLGSTKAKYVTPTGDITATANAGWVFKEWQFSKTDDDYDAYAADDYNSYSNPVHINAVHNGTLTAVFEPRYYLVGKIWDDSADGGMPGWDNYNKPFKVVTTSPVLDTCKLTLSANKSFYIMVRDKADGFSYGKSGETLEDNETLTFTDKDNKVFVYSNGGTEYTFKITAIDGNGRPTVSVERPYQVNVGRKRVDIDGADHDDNTGGTVAMSKTSGGDAVANGAWVPYGTSVKYDASAESGYSLAWYTASDYATQFTTDAYWFHIATSTGNGYAKFTEKATTVTLANDGNGKVQISSTDKTSTTCGVTTTRSLTAVPNDGYQFSSWAKTSCTDYNVSTTSEATTTLSGLGSGAASGQTLTANFTAKTYSVKLNNDHGGESSDDGSATATYDATSLSSITHAKFSGWTLLGYWNSSALQVANADGSLIANVDGYTGAGGKWTNDAGETVNLWAHWSRSVTLDDNGGSADGSVTVTYKGTAATPSAPTKTGYHVEAYYAEAGCTHKVMETDGTLVNYSGYVTDGKWTKTDATTLYAKWEANTYTVTLHNDHDGASSDDGTATATYDATSLSSITHAQFEGWTLLGYWNSSAVQVADANGDLKAGVSTFTDSDGKWTKTDDAEVWAHWSRTITLDDNVEHRHNGSVSVTYKGAAASHSAPASRTGYTLAGYYDDAAGTTKVMNANGTLVSNVSGYTDGSGNWTHKTAATLYAKWTSDHFIIYRTGDKDDDPRKLGTDVESYAGGTLDQSVEFRMKVRDLDMWYTLCLPFTVNAVKVWDEEDGQYYAIEPYYRTEVGATLNGGHYIIRKPKQTIDLPISEFGDWRDPTSATDYVPTKDTAYIIQWHNSYFLNKYVSFFGATGQTIPTSFTAGAAPSVDNVVNVHGNNSMQSGSVAGAYLFEADYGNGAWLRSENVNEARTINPFECYVRASSGTTGRFLVIRRGMTIEDTATGWDDVLNSETKEHILVYSLSGICVTQLHDCSLTEAGQRLSESLSEGLYILYAGNESVKLMVGGK